MARLLYSILLLTCIAGCSRDVGRVGSMRITEKDIEQRAKVAEIYYPDSGKRFVALAQLIKGDLAAEVLRAQGRIIDKSVLDAEALRIDRNTRAPETLERIKQVYGSDRAGYLNTFVRIVYAERILYGEVFQSSKEIHEESYRKAQSFLSSVSASPTSFTKTAKKIGMAPALLLVSDKDGIVPYEQRKQGAAAFPSAGMESAERIISMLSRVNSGRIVPQVIEWPESYQVIRFVKPKGKAYVIESVGIPKRNFDEWFWEQASKIPVRINDAALQAELLKEVGWTKMLQLE